MICQPRRQNRPSDPRARSSAARAPGLPPGTSAGSQAGPTGWSAPPARGGSPPPPGPGPGAPPRAPPSHLAPPPAGPGSSPGPGAANCPRAPPGTVPAPPALTLPLPPSPTLPPPAPRPRLGAARRAGHTRCGGLGKVRRRRGSPEGPGGCAGGARAGARWAPADSDREPPLPPSRRRERAPPGPGGFGES